MRFLLDDINVQLQSEADTEQYEHSITSEEICNGKRTLNSSKKILDLKVVREENRIPKILIKTKEHSITLDNLLKKQEGIKLRMAALTDTVLVGIDKQGEIESIHNHHIIQQKWESLRNELQRLYEGNTVDRYFIGIDKKIKDERKLLIDFQQARLFGLLFNGLYDSYTLSKRPITTRKKTLHAMIDHIPLVIDEAIYCDKVDTDKGALTLRVKGSLDRKETYITKIENHLVGKGISHTSDFALSSYNGTFQFNTKTGLILHSSLEIETMFGKDYYKKDQLEIKNISA